MAESTEGLDFVSGVSDNRGETYYGFMFTLHNNNRDEKTRMREYKGIIMYDDGSIFEGHFTRGVEEGLGRKITANLEYYYGNFDNGKPNGRGKSVASNGTYYEGEFSNGVPEGEGSENLVSGEKYAGSFHRGKRHGKGTLIE